MKTSRRRPPVIAWAIAAASLCAAIGTGTAAPAGADDSGRGGDVKPAGTTDPADGAGSRRHARDRPDPPADGGGWHPCRPIPPGPPPLPINGGDNRGDSGFLPPVIVPVTPIPVFAGGVQPRADVFDVPDLAALSPAASAPAAPAAPPPLAWGPPSAQPPPRSGPVAAPIPLRSAPVPLPRTAPPGAAKPLPPQPAGVPGEAAAPVRLGYPDADLAKALAVALPGLAAMAGMTALGGLIGYRQAKAGYLLRAAGAGRFLQ